MKRTGFKKSSQSTFKKACKKIPHGKKVDEWAEVRNELKQVFLEAGITSCELKCPECLKTLFLGFAHAVKRRYLRDDADLGSPNHIKTCILACQKCHTFLDHKLKENEMRHVVMDIIKNRKL